MKKLTLILSLIFSVGISFAHAQGIQQCYTTTGTNCIPVSPSNPLPVTTNSQVNITPTDCSGTITAGGTAQALFTAQTGLHGFTIMNLSTDKLGIAFNGTAVVDAAGTYSLNPATTGATGTAGGSYSSPLGFGVNTAVSIVGATTGDKYSCTRW